MKQDVDDYEHKKRNAEQPSEHVFTHDFSPEELGPPAKRACAPYGYASELQLTCHRKLTIAGGREAVETGNGPIA